MSFDRSNDRATAPPLEQQRQREDCDLAIRHLNAGVRQLNRLIAEAVAAGASVELIRSGCCYGDRGTHGAQYVPSIRFSKKETSSRRTDTQFKCRQTSPISGRDPYDETI